MNQNINPNKKIELLERQKDDFNSIQFDEDAEQNAIVIRNNTIHLFEILFKENLQWTKELSSLNFDPHTYSLDRNNRLTSKRSPEHFIKCVKKANIILDSAISKIKIEQELTEITETSNVTNQTISKDMNKVFIVHGHDDGLKNEVALFIKRLGLEDVILHQQTNRGRTIIEKFEANSDVGFAIVLYTPCDVGRSASSEDNKPRARQNVIFEHGYFVAKLGRENVVALNKGDVEIPNDLSGMIYTSYEKDNWERQIAHELKASGYKIDFEKI